MRKLLSGAIGLELLCTSGALAANDCRLQGYWLSNHPNEKITFSMIKSGEDEGFFNWQVDNYITDGKYAILSNGGSIHFIGNTKDTHSGFEKHFDATYSIAMRSADFPVSIILKGDNPLMEPQEFHRNTSDPTDTSLIESLCNL